METEKLVLVVSLTLNVNLVVYLFPPIALVWFLRRRDKPGKVAIGILRCYRKHPNILRKLLKDFLLSSAVFIFGVYLLFHGKIYQNPFESFVDNRLRTAMAVLIGNYLFRLANHMFSMQDIIYSFSYSCYGMLTIFSALIILITKENNIFALLSLLFEGGVICSDISRAEKSSNDDVCERKTQRVITLLGNFIATLSVRVVCPTVLLVYSLCNSNVLRMSYIGLSGFVLDVVFYSSLSVLELYLVYKSLRAVCEETGADNDIVLPARPPMNNSNTFSAVSASRIAINSTGSPRVVTEPVSGMPNGAIIKNF